MLRGKAAEFYAAASEERTDDPTDDIRFLLAMQASLCDSWQEALEQNPPNLEAAIYYRQQATKLGVDLAKLRQAESKRELAVPLDAVRNYIQRIADFVVTFLPDPADQVRCRRGIIGIPLVGD